MMLELTQAEVLTVLHDVPLFSALSKRQLRAVAGACSTVRRGAGDVLVKQLEVAQHLLVVVEGTADVVRHGRTVATIGPGDTIGEMSLIDGLPRSASVVARDDVFAVVLYATHFRRLLQEEPSICGKMLLAQTRRLREVDERLSSLV